ncbi:MAG: T9SS type A sorting domain-containing protein [Thermaurantimonas sp.]
MKNLYSLTLSVLSVAVFGQIFAPEGLNMPGAWNSWTNPPTNPALGGVQVTGGRVQIKTGLGTSIYQTIFSVATSGGDLVGGTYAWLFTSGPLTNPYQNKWANVAVTTNTVQTYTFGGATDNTATLINGKWYTINYRNLGYSNTQAIFMETSSEPRTIVSVTTSQPLTNVFPGEQVVTINLSGTPASDEYFYLRWTTDNFLTTNNITPFTISGATGTATIPVSPNQNIAFYVFSSSISSISSGESSLYYDMRTIHFNNNSGSNYTFTVNPAYRTIATTGTYPFNTASTWRGNVVPPSGSRIQVEPDVVLDASLLALNLDSIELLGTGAQLDLINSELSLVADAALVAASGSSVITNSLTLIEFLGIGHIPNSVILGGKVAINNQLNLGSNVNFTGTLELKTGGFVSTNAPIYSTSSELKYTAATYSIGLEWSHTGVGTIGTTPGYPYNVTVGTGINPSILNLTNLDRAAEGTLTINSGSTFNYTNTTISADLRVNNGLDIIGTLNMNNSNRKIIVHGNVFIDNVGTLNLSTAVGGDLELVSFGGIICNGTLNTNNRAVFFTNNSGGVISGSAPLSLPYIIISNSTVQNLAILTVDNNGFIELSSGSLFENNSIITLKANASNYAKISVCATCTLTGTGTLTKEAYFAAGAANTNPLSSDFNDGKNGRWFSVGFPMPGAAMNSFDGGTPAFFSTATPGPIARWDANTGNYIYPSSINTDNFMANAGYVIYMGENQHGIITRNLSTQNLVSLQMTMSNLSSTINLGYTNTPVFTNIFGSNTDGWNLVVNPYLAPLNIKSTLTTNADGTAYIYNPTTGNFTTYNFSDPTDFYIAPLQAFWVRATSAGGSISVLPANQATNVNPAQAKPQITTDHAWLKLSRADGSEDQLRIYFRAEATDSYEPAYDSEKLKGDAARISLYSTTGAKPLATDSRSTIISSKHIPIHVYCSNPSVMKIELESLGLPAGYHAWLEDHITGKIIHIEDGAYDFMQQITGNHQRFTLHIAQQIVGISEQDNSDAYQIWTADDVLHFFLGANATNGNFIIFDMTGKKVLEKKFNGISGQHLTFSISTLPKGLYVLRFKANETEKTLKFAR